jgi:twitching motility protein PilT
MAQIDAFFTMMQDLGASDLHLSSGSQPIVRLHGALQRVKFKVLEHEDLKKLLFEITPEPKIKEFEELGDVDFAYAVPGVSRYRVNFFMQSRGIAAAFRTIPEKVLTLDDLGMPPVIRDFCKLPKGLVLVTGPTGSGKSTTLAAMIDHINVERQEHILTIEDPIEFLHQPKNCLINQREVGRDTRSFNSALRGALREDPDVILVGEMRDLETIRLALEAAETGHLVFSTLHTISAAKTVDRIIEVFPGDQQEQIRSALSESLRGIVAQTLFKRVDKPGRCAALEILVALPSVRNLIRERRTFQINSVIETGKNQGMQTLDDAIMDHLTAKRISPEDAYNKAIQKARFKDMLPAPPSGMDD